MRHKLRNFLFILIAGLIFWLNSVTPAAAKVEGSQSRIRHILERLSFGVTAEEIQQVETQGIEAFIQSQLNPQSIAESPLLAQHLNQLDLSLIEQNPIALRQQMGANLKKLKNTKLSLEQQEEIQQQNIELNRETRDQATYVQLARAIYSRRQLQEVMVDFWFNHFNVYGAKNAINFWLDDYVNELRNYAFADFRDLLQITATHPAMLIYLDNQFNSDPNSSDARGAYGGLNENYARELLELHTLGVDGGYTQKDIQSLARIFTGWSVDYQGKKGNKIGFYFNARRHDQGEKVFLGQKITATGMGEGEQALDILATHPATARFISYKLAQYFVADQPPATLVDNLAQTFLTSNGNIKIVLDTLIHSKEFNDPRFYQQKFKTPYQYLISLVRMSEIVQPDFKRIKGMLNQLSMPMYMCVAPTGYKNTQQAWLNPQSMLQKIGFATAIANGSLNRDFSLDDQQLEANLGQLSPHTQQVINQSPPKLLKALLLGSPEAMYR
ncbi:hypothetical protein NIES4102_24910 [Chondrocystis sp. NIES-4102]|nr:hypothetical protein NIES4102_24910 [Chondrocystis sp. NIES-4102]